MKKVFVTGASGHIGFHIAKGLLEKGYDVHVLIRKENINISFLKKIGAVLHFCDLHKPHTYADLLSDTDAVFHLAAENTIKTSAEQFVIDNTYGLTKTFLDTVILQNVPVIIYTSSVVVFGRSNDPNIILNETYKAKTNESPYVKGKAMAEDYCTELIEKRNIDIRRIYPSWIIGWGFAKETPPHKIINDYIKRGMLFYFKGGVSIASVEKVAEAHIVAYEKGIKKGQYITAGSNITFRQLYRIFAKYAGRREPKIFLPKWLIVFGAIITKPIFKMLGLQLILDPGYARAIIGNYSWYDSSKAIKELGYQIEPAEDVLARAIIDEISKNY